MQIKFTGITLLILFSHVFYSCSNRGSNETYESSPIEKEVEYEDAKMTVEEIESSEPLKFLKSQGTYRPALFGGNFLLEGWIKNNATSVTYKDIRIEFEYYTRTNTLLNKETRVFYEYIQPGRSHEFRFKVNAPGATSIINWHVVGALAE